MNIFHQVFYALHRLQRNLCLYELINKLANLVLKWNIGHLLICTLI